MSEPKEPITPYGLMFGPPVPCTLREIDQAFRRLPADWLLHAAALGTVLGWTFDQAFGGGDMRTRAATTVAFGPVALELDGRGLRIPRTDEEILAALNEWMESLAQRELEATSIPPHRLGHLSNNVREALGWLGQDAPVRVLLERVLNAVEGFPQVFDTASSVSSVSTPPPAIRAIARKPVPVFVAYAHRDALFRDALVAHISPLRRLGKIAAWNDREIGAGMDWEDEIDEHLEAAQIILLLVSPDFVQADYCYGKEMRRALERHDAGDAIAIPIVVRPVFWKELPFARVQMLPQDARSVADWSSPDNAWVNVVEGINAAIERVRAADR